MFSVKFEYVTDHNYEKPFVQPIFLYCDEHETSIIKRTGEYL
jgi:hypothetical protein